MSALHRFLQWIETPVVRLSFWLGLDSDDDDRDVAMNVDSLIALRARQKREHRISSRTDARLYDALHDQLRREVRSTRFRKTAENLAAVAIGVGFFVILAVAI